MYGHLKTGTVEAPDVNEIVGRPRKQITCAIPLTGFLIKEQQTVEEVLAHTVGDTSSNVTRKHPQEKAK